jgi:DNA-binding NtrC family response regulator
MTTRPRQSGANQTPTRVLVVDDEPGARETAAAVLSIQSFVETAPHGTAALAMLEKGEFEVLVVDYQMPGMSGTELLARAAKHYPNVVGILVTGHADLPEVRRARRSSDVFLVLLKPYDPAELMRWVGMAGRTSRLRRANETLGRQLGKS